MLRKDCNISHSSEELEKSYSLQKSKTEVDEHEKNLQAKGSAQSSLSVFPGLDRKKQNLRSMQKSKLMTFTSNTWSEVNSGLTPWIYMF